MSGRPQRQTGLERLHDEIRTDFKRLDAGCRRYGVTATMFRTAKFLFHSLVILFVVYLMETAGVQWEVAAGIAIILIAGPEGLETWLAHQGVLTDGGTADECDRSEDDA